MTSIQTVAKRNLGTRLMWGGKFGWIAEWNRRRLVRKSYGQMPDAQLRDIGLTAHDIMLALYLPWNRNAADEIAAAARAEASRW